MPVFSPYGDGGKPRYQLLATGQLTQYSSELDDGYYRKGRPKSYTIGTQTGTTNVDLAHYTGVAGHISFNNVAHTITDSDGGLAIFKTGDVITTNTPNNLGPFTITTGNVAGTITCTGATFVTETPAGAVTIYKREVISNVTVFDNNTGLMWMQKFPTKMGSTSVGNMPWTGQLYDIFAWCAACNAAGVGGYSDWRIPNFFDLISLMDFEQPTAFPDATAFPGWSTGNVWSSTTKPNVTTERHTISYQNCALSSYATTVENKVVLIRG